MIGSTALFMRHVAHPEGRPDQVAATDGRSVYFWPEYFKFGLGDRLGVLLHEYLHAAFAHPMRGMRLRRRFLEAFNETIFGVAADAIVNEAIKRGTSSRIGLPEGCIELAKLLEQAKAIVKLTGLQVDIDRMQHINKLSVEWLYETFVKLFSAAIKNQREDTQTDAPLGEGQASNDNARSGITPADRQAASGQSRDQLARDNFIEQMSAPSDLLLDNLRGLSIEDLNEHIRQARDRIRAAQGMHAHGMNSRDVLEHLTGDIPVVNTPWETSFRSLTQRHLSPKRLRQPTRPGRRVLSQLALGVQHIVWSAGRRRPPVPIVMVVLDSSGSIDAAEYLRWLGEIQAMKRRTNAHVIAVVADAAIQSVAVINNIREIAEVKFEGRGGTDFRPAIALAEEMQVDLVVYLTDLVGAFPANAPTVPVLWTVNASEPPHEPPFGNVLCLR